MNLDGLPVIGLAAVIAGHPAVNVESTGQFFIADVTAPYDLILVDGAAQHATVYRGLTRADPTIVVSAGLPGARVVVSGAEVSLPSTSVDMIVVQSVTLVSGTPPSSPVGIGVGEGDGFCA